MAGEILPGTQCGFRKGRSCMDIVFTVRRVVGNLYEHQQAWFLVFFYLKRHIFM